MFGPHPRAIGTLAHLALSRRKGTESHPNQSSGNVPWTGYLPRPVSKATRLLTIFQKWKLGGIGRRINQPQRDKFALDILAERGS
jgi:hypothetical protein